MLGEPSAIRVVARAFGDSKGGNEEIMNFNANFSLIVCSGGTGVLSDGVCCLKQKEACTS